MAKWSSKDERQYEHVKESEQKRGRGTRRAKEIAARTVNKQRSQEARTKGDGSANSGGSSRGGSRSRGSSARGGSRRTSGNGGDLKRQTREQLYDRARKMDIEGRSRMNKSQLVRAIQRSS